MGFEQVGFSVWLLFAVGISAARWPTWRSAQMPAEFQPNEPGQVLGQVNAGALSQNIQGGSESGVPARAPLGFHLQTPSDAQSQRVFQRPGKAITWRYPAAPQIPTLPAPVHFERQSDPVPAQGVTAQCMESAVYVEVRKDLFRNEATFKAADLSLGGCAAKDLDASSEVVVFESALHGCNSKLTVTARELVYSFTLAIASVPSSGSPIVRRAGTRVSIECHYPRHHNVSSSALMPAWIPYASAQAAEELLVFSLRLMMEDWTLERGSNQYYLGEVINIEASVLQFKHVPLRVLVDSCVATTAPDVNAVPSYSFIENHGCFVDAELTHSSSRFLPQTRADKLRLQLEAFKFQQMSSSLVYIACMLKATAASAPADAENKACSFSGNRWSAVYGADQVCSCCGSSCVLRNGHDLSPQGARLEQNVTLGPIVIKENVW